MFMVMRMFMCACVFFVVRVLARGVVFAVGFACMVVYVCCFRVVLFVFDCRCCCVCVVFCVVCVVVVCLCCVCLYMTNARITPQHNTTSNTVNKKKTKIYTQHTSHQHMHTHHRYNIHTHTT